MRRVTKALGAVLAMFCLGMGAAVAAPRNYALPEETASFRPGPGVEAARDNCLACHSADYVNTQPPHMGDAFWQAEVAKMIRAYRAPISAEDAKAIADYLSRAY